MPLQRRQSHVVEAQSTTGSSRLAREALADQRNSGDPSGFGGNGCPQHGGRTTTSTAVADDDPIDPLGSQLGTERGYKLRFVGAVNVPKVVVPNDFKAGEPFGQLTLDCGEQFFASEQVIPYEADSFTGKLVEPLGQRPLLTTCRRFRPHDVEARFQSFHPAMMPDLRNP